MAGNRQSAPIPRGPGCSRESLAHDYAVLPERADAVTRVPTTDLITRRLTSKNTTS